MATLLEIRNAIKKKLVDTYFYPDSDINLLINNALQSISGGVIMPDGEISPPLPDLYTSENLTTSTTYPYVDLPDDYQRNVFYVSDNVDYKIHPVNGGDYYSFTLFMNQAIKKDLSLAGIVTTVAIKGNKIFYQGIPAAPSRLTVQYYRAPDTLTADGDVPEGIPVHLASPILMHYVLKEIFGDSIEDGENSESRGYQHHTKKFYEYMTTMIRFNGTDDEPVYYGVTDSYPRDDW